MEFIEPLEIEDLERLKLVQPEDWPDVSPFFEYYIKSDFCNPIKLIKGQKIIGVGSSIRHINTAWLAHIIVQKDYRNQGKGSKITQALIEMNRKQKIKTQLLIATELGYPVYLKNGFEIINEYVLFRKGKNYERPTISKKIFPYEPKYWNEVLKMDQMISGEQRAKILWEKLSYAFVYFEENNLQGFYSPDLGDGMIVAKNAKAGLELMKLRLTKKDQAMLPVENKAGIQLLQDLRFVEQQRVKRMHLGKELNWKPELLFNRIGGYLG